MGNVNYWLFNMDYKNNNGDIVWQHCKKNNCFIMKKNEGEKVSVNAKKTLKLIEEIKVGDYCVAYSGNKTIIGIGKVTREYYLDDNINKGIFEGSDSFGRIGVKWSIMLEKELIIDKFTKSLGVITQGTLAYSVTNINEEGFRYAKLMCEKIIMLTNKNRFKKK